MGAYRVGDEVYKIGRGYRGPGKVVAVFLLSPENEWRYVVAHKIEGGTGKLLHIYSEAQLERASGSGGNADDEPTG